MSDDNTLVRILIVLVAVVILVPFLMMVFAWPMMGAWGGGHMWNGGMWDGTGATWTWLLMWVIMLLILVGGGYVLYRAISQTNGDGTDTALEELRLAYARGDLSDEEFDERRTRLQHD